MVVPLYWIIGSNEAGIAERLPWVLGIPRTRVLPKSKERIWICGILLHGWQLHVLGENVQASLTGEIWTIHKPRSRLEQLIKTKSRGKGNSR